MAILEKMKLRYVLLNIIIPLPVYIFIMYTVTEGFKSNPLLQYIVVFMYIKNVFYESKMDYLDGKIIELKNKLNN